MMKKIFWTSIVRIILIGIFVFYMKWFNQGLATGFSNFIVVNDCMAPEEVYSGEVLDIDEDINLNLEEEIVLSDRDKLFEQLDRIEDSISEIEIGNIKSGLTEEEMFDEFKLWYEESKK